jgi:hypothetical protein
MDDATSKTIGIFAFMFLPLIVLVIVFIFGDGFKRRISSGLSILFSLILGVCVYNVEPLLFLLYPIVCASAFVVFFIFELFFWYVVKKRRIAKLRKHLQTQGKLEITDFIAQVSIDDVGRLRIAPRTRSFPAIQKVYDDIMWDAERRDLCPAKRHEWGCLRWCRHIIKGVASSYGCTLMLHPETHWVDVPSRLKSDIESLLKKSWERHVDDNINRARVD